MKRESYKGFEIYPEIHYVKGLTNEQLLVFGMIYNLTGKNARDYYHPLNVNGITRAMKDHYQKFDLKKPLTRTKWLPIVEQLEGIEWLRNLGTEVRVTEFGEKRVTRYTLTPDAIRNINIAKKEMEIIQNTPDVTPLF